MTYLLAFRLALGGEKHVQIRGLRSAANQFLSFQSFLWMALDKENEWIKNANRLPWKASFKLAVEEIEKENGQTKEK